MPYRRNYKRKTYARKAAVNKTVKSYVRSQVAKSEMKDHPLLWADIIFEGDSVSTSPDAYSLVSAFIQNAAIRTANAWPATTTINGVQTRKAKIKLESAHYQLRYQNDTTDLFSTARFLMYSTTSRIDSGATPIANPILNGTNIDSPPDTSNILNMYFDKLRYVRDLQADEDSEAPGTAIMKGNVRFGRTFNIDLDQNDDWFVENNDIRYEHQSNSSTAPHPSLYGFIRVYGRVIY